MERMNAQVVRITMKRSDARILFLHFLQEYGVHGYEFTLLNNEFMCCVIGRILQRNRIPIHLVIRYFVFQQSFTENIKGLFIK